jgi:hypothetical protein
MSDIQPITRERHSHRAWNRAVGFGWASHERIVALGRQEAMQLMMTLPLGFVRQGDQPLLVAVVGLRPGENLMIGADGKWLWPSVPTALQHYPFRLLRDTEGRELLAIDEAGLLPPEAPGGTALYDSDGQPVAELGTILAQLSQSEQERQQARQIAALLDQHGLLELWELKFQGEAGVQKIDGLYRVNEEKLNELPPEVLQTLRNGGALAMAYCQLLSMQHIHYVAQLAAARARQRPTQAVPKEVASSLVGDSGIISFANL